MTAVLKRLRRPKNCYWCDRAACLRVCSSPFTVCSWHAWLAPGYFLPVILYAFCKEGQHTLIFWRVLSFDADAWRGATAVLLLLVPQRQLGSLKCLKIPGVNWGLWNPPVSTGFTEIPRCQLGSLKFTSVNWGLWNSQCQLRSLNFHSVNCCCCCLHIEPFFSFYPTISAVHPVSVLTHPREIQILWWQAVRQRKTKK